MARRPTRWLADRFQTAVGAAVASGGASQSCAAHVPKRDDTCGLYRDCHRRCSGARQRRHRCCVAALLRCSSLYSTAYVHNRPFSWHQNLACRQNHRHARRNERLGGQSQDRVGLRPVLRPSVRIPRSARRHAQGLVVVRRRPVSAGEAPRPWSLRLATGAQRHCLADPGAVVDADQRDRRASAGAYLAADVGLVYVRCLA